MLELVTTAAIIGLLTVSAFPFLRQYQMQLDLEEAALALQNCFVAAQDYARAPSSGAVSYRATLYPLEQKCTVSRQTAVLEIMDEYTFAGLNITNTASLALREFTLVAGTDVLRTVSYTTVNTGGVSGQAFAPAAVAVWQLRPAGRTTPVKGLTVNLVHGIVTVQL